MRPRASFQIAPLALVGLCTWGIGAFSPRLWADDVYLKKEAQSIQGRVLTEKADAFVVEIPKDQIQRIERNSPPAEVQEQASTNVLWEERGDVVVLTVPRQMLHIVKQGAGNTVPIVRAPNQDHAAVVQTATAPVAPTADTRLGSVTGRVVWNGGPTEGCRVKVVQISRVDSLRFTARLLGVSEAEAAKETTMQEAVSDATGHYRIERLVPGEYDIYWMPHNGTGWIRRLSDRPDLIVVAGEATTYPDIKAHVQTVN